MLVHLWSWMEVPDRCSPMQSVKHVDWLALNRWHHDNVVVLLSQLLFVIDQLHPLLSRPLLDLPFQSRVIMVLNVVVCAAREVLGDLRPSISICLMELQDALVFGGRPLDLFDVGVEMIVPSE